MMPAARAIVRVMYDSASSRRQGRGTHVTIQLLSIRSSRLFSGRPAAKKKRSPKWAPLNFI
jgi:hypothetical protein